MFATAVLCLTRKGWSWVPEELTTTRVTLPGDELGVCGNLARPWRPPEVTERVGELPPEPMEGIHVVTTKSDFSEEEWSRIVRAPFVAGMAITLADPGGPIEAAKETMATIKQATNPPSREQLLTDTALDIQAMTQQKHNPLKGYKLEKGQSPGNQVLDELRAVRGIVVARATPEEAEAFGQWLVAAAQASADAAKEGGFMGFHAVRVSEREQAMLDQVRAAVTE
jgi:hypothetical protein